MKVKEVMTARSLKYCSSETKLHNAAKTMKSANCGALPVIDKEKKVVGLVTDRDICLSLATKQARSISDVSVGKVMTSKVHTVKAEDEISSALHQMRINKIGRIPVVDENGKLKGIISMHNLLSRATADGKIEMGTLFSPGENLMKTMQAITDRYSNGKHKKVK